MKTWRCTVCGLLYEGEDPPESCFKCGAPSAVLRREGQSAREQEQVGMTTPVPALRYFLDMPGEHYTPGPGE